MFRKMLMSAAFVIIAVVSSAVVANAQYATITGRIENEAKEPIAGALVEVYNQSAKTTRSPATTDKKGVFNFVGAQFGEAFILVVSVPGYAPNLQGGIKAGMDKIVIPLAKGDGHKFTPDEVKTYISRKPSTTKPTGDAEQQAELTPDQKKQQEAEAAELKRVQESNTKIEKTNETVARAFAAGSTAFDAGDYNAAIASYTEAYNADPTFLGSAPILLTNIGLAHYKRGAATFNKDSKNPDVQAQIAAKASARKDFLDSAKSFAAAYDLYKTGTGPGLDPAAIEKGRNSALRSLADTVLAVIQSEQVDPEIVEPVGRLIPEYLKIETDAAKKEKAMRYLGDIYRLGGQYEKSIAEYRAVLAVQPDNIDALGLLGIVLYSQGSIEDNKPMKQEGADTLGKFVAKAPDTHRYKQDAVAILAELKNEQIAPTKGAGGPKKKN